MTPIQGCVLVSLYSKDANTDMHFLWHHSWPDFLTNVNHSCVVVAWGKKNAGRCLGQMWCIGSPCKMNRWLYHSTQSMDDCKCEASTHSQLTAMDLPFSTHTNSCEPCVLCGALGKRCRCVSRSVVVSWQPNQNEWAASLPRRVQLILNSHQTHIHSTSQWTCILAHHNAHIWTSVCCSVLENKTYLGLLWWDTWAALLQHKLTHSLIALICVLYCTSIMGTLRKKNQMILSKIFFQYRFEIKGNHNVLDV